MCWRGARPDASARGTGRGVIDAQNRHNAWVSTFTGVFAARAVSSLATLAGIMLMGRHLGPAHYGNLVVLLTLSKVGAELAGPAIDTGVVRFAAMHWPGPGEAGLRYLRAGFWAKAVLAVLLLAAGVFLAGPVRQAVYGPVDGAQVPLYAVRLAFLAAALTVSWAFTQACFQARHRFGKYALSEMLAALTRLGFVGGTVLAARWAQWPLTQSVVLFLGAYALGTGIATLYGAAQFPRGLLERPATAWAVAGELFRFTKWVLLACCFTSVAHRLDILLVKALGLAQQAVGDYAAAVQLVLLGDLVILTLFNVLLPKASGLRTRGDMAAFLRGFRFPALLASVAMVPVVLGSGWIARIAFGSEFIQTGSFFGILLIGALFSLGCAPAGTALYAMGKSHVVALFEGAKLACIAGLGWWAAHTYGAEGMAWTMTAVKSTIGILTVVAAHWAARGMPISVDGGAMGSQDEGGRHA